MLFSFALFPSSLLLLWSFSYWSIAASTEFYRLFRTVQHIQRWSNNACVFSFVGFFFLLGGGEGGWKNSKLLGIFILSELLVYVGIRKFGIILVDDLVYFIYS